MPRASVSASALANTSTGLPLAMPWSRSPEAANCSATVTPGRVASKARATSRMASVRLAAAATVICCAAAGLRLASASSKTKKNLIGGSPA